jgi:hypothetical protein
METKIMVVDLIFDIIDIIIKKGNLGEGNFL